MSQYRPSYNNSRVQRSPNGKPSYSPGNWKNYIISDFNKKPDDNRSSRDSASIMRTGSPINSSYYQAVTDRQQKQRKKEQMMRRVRNIQDRVMPLINNENHHGGDEQVGWKNKMEQKVAKLETAVDAVQKQLLIKMEKHVMQLQKKMMEKYLDLQAMLEARSA